MTDVLQAITWEFGRVGGMVAYILATASVCIGLLLSLKVRSSSWPRFVTDGAHRYVTLLALVFTAIHGIAVWVDPFIAFTPAEVLIPFASHYRPLWIALGIVAGYLLVAVWASEWIRPRVGYAWWRRFHYLSFGIFVLGTLHGIGTGSDTATWWGVATYAIAVGTTTILLTWRLWLAASPRFRMPSVTAVAALAVLLAIWMAVAPLQPGWNAVANNGNGNGERNPSAVPSVIRNSGDEEQNEHDRTTRHEDGESDG